MMITNEQLKGIYFGAYRFEENDGYLEGYHFTKEQIEYLSSLTEFWAERCRVTNAKTLEFTTSATEFSFEYKVLPTPAMDTVELMVDGVLMKIYNTKEMSAEGKMTFEMPEGEKSVVVYLTGDCKIGIRNFEINADYKPAKKGDKVLWIGDSITQGYGPYRTAHMYVSSANRYLNYDIINQGVGGYRYDAKLLCEMPGYKPDKIIVAYGTNQYNEDGAAETVECFYEKLRELYGEIPVLCITPIWRGDQSETYDIFKGFGETIIKICERYKNIKVVDGLKLVPHLYEYFLDGLHPNALGGEVYGRNLVEEIKKIGF
ncbi:MAG: SGNH/GDSL hydrolase family protein [Clostridia bacterium]|nr:SGNH/GDSL hydrolase family protein [Clostridia bacterium]